MRSPWIWIACGRPLVRVAVEVTLCVLQPHHRLKELALCFPQIALAGIVEREYQRVQED